MYTIYEGRIINNLDDVLGVLRDKLGDEFADTTENIVSDMVSTADDVNHKVYVRQIEVTNEAWTTIVRDARDNIDEILSKSRIDRRVLARIRDDLNAEL